MIIDCHIKKEFHVNEDKKENITSYFHGRRLPSTFQAYKESSSYAIMYVGSDTRPFFANLLLSEASKNVPVYRMKVEDTQTLSIDFDHCQNRIFLKRLYFVQKVKASKCFGILVGTFSVNKLEIVLDQLKRLLRQNGKNFYTFVVGKINVPKLGNFLDVDMFVLVGCPENNLIFDQNIYKEFHRPIITPIELLLGLSDDPFLSKYSLNFDELLDSISSNQSGSFETNLSTMPGQSSVLTAVNRDFASICLSQKKSQGLQYEVNNGSLQDIKILEGRRGIASEYNEEIK